MSIKGPYKNRETTETEKLSFGIFNICAVLFGIIVIYLVIKFLWTPLLLCAIAFAAWYAITQLPKLWRRK